MKHNVATYFTENEQDDVKGFTIIGNDDRYHVAEKWNRDSENDTWTDYHITEEQLQARLDADKCEAVGTLTDEQYAAVCGKVDHDEVTPEKTLA